MNKLATSAAALLMLSAPAFAAGVEVAPLIATATEEPLGRSYQLYGWAEYGVENEQFESALGIDYFLTDRLTAFGEVSVIKVDGEELDFDTFDLGLSYSLTYNVSAYTFVEFNDDFDYENLTVGMSFVY